MCVYCGAIFPLGGNGRLSLAAHFERAHGIKQVKKKIHLVRLGDNNKKGATLLGLLTQPPYSSNSPSPNPLEPHLSPYTHTHALRPRRFYSKKELEHHLWQAHRIRYAHHYTTIRVNPRFWICRKCAEPWKTKYKLRRDIERHLKSIHNVDIGSDGKYQGIYYQKLVSGYLCKLCEAIREVKV
jgi:ribosomal protein L37AE/L43A